MKNQNNVQHAVQLHFVARCVTKGIARRLLKFRSTHHDNLDSRLLLREENFANIPDLYKPAHILSPPSSIVNQDIPMTMNTLKSVRTHHRSVSLAPCCRSRSATRRTFAALSTYTHMQKCQALGRTSKNGLLQGRCSNSQKADSEGAAYLSTPVMLLQKTLSLDLAMCTHPHRLDENNGKTTVVCPRNESKKQTNNHCLRAEDSRKSFLTRAVTAVERD